LQVKVSTHELGAFTTYTKRVYYDTYDATDAMRLAGGSSHTIGVSVGDGWYSQDSVNVGQQTLILQVRTAPRCCALQRADASVSCACGLVCVCSGGTVRPCGSAPVCSSRSRPVKERRRRRRRP